jgi:hypothetical protein
MYHLSSWFEANSGAITAIAAFIAALATLAYLIATIKIFRETKKSADAAAEAARAATRSADLASELHRPFMALESVILRNAIEPKQTNWRQDSTWIIDWSIANFGTLPANHVHATIELRSFHVPKLDEGPYDAEIYPQSQPVTRTTLLLVNPAEALQGSIHASAHVAIDYASPAGTCYRHTAEALFDNARGIFSISESKTEIIEQGKSVAAQKPILTA